MIDCYKILGVEKTATQAEIKSAYRKLAKKYHPDTSKEHDAEEKFKEVANAYEILGDPDKRAKYDNPMSDMYTNAGTSTQTGWHRVHFHFDQPKPVNDSIVHNIELDAEDTLKNHTITIDYQRVVGKCKTCSGSGGQSDICGSCNGSGMHSFETNGRMFQIGVCHSCRGSGKTVIDVCNDCMGFGMQIENVKKQLDIPVGVISKPIRVKGWGHHYNHSVPPGDLFVRVVGIKHKKFQFDGNLNCCLKIDIDPVEAIVGTQKTITMLGGATRQITIPAGCKRGLVEVFKGLGIPVEENQRTEFRVYVEYVLPRRLSEKKLKHLQAYLNETE